MRLPTARSRRRSTGTRARDVRAPLTNSRRATRSGARRLMQSSQRAETQATESLTFKPEINAVSGVGSRLKVFSEPESYLAGSVSIWH